MKRVMIVNDSPVLTAVMKAILQTTEEYDVVATAVDGNAAIISATKNKIDLVLMDIHMPGMSGVECTRVLLQVFNKIKVLITTATIHRNKTYLYEALKEGAVDFVRTPALAQTPGSQVSTDDLKQAGKELLNKLHTLDYVDNKKQTAHASTQRPAQSVQSHFRVKSQATSTPMICIGSSTGGPTTLVRLISNFLSRLKHPKRLPVAIVICQHIEEGFTEGLSEWLSTQLGLKTVEVTHRMKVEAGVIYLAYGGKDLIALDDGYLRVVERSEDSPYHPNIDRFFNSVSTTSGANSTGIILTGMGKDGAEGLLNMRQAGCDIYVQDVDSAIIEGMPKAALSINEMQQGSTLVDIGQSLAQTVNELAR